MTVDPTSDRLLATEVAEGVELALSVSADDETLLGCVIDGIGKAGWDLVRAADNDTADLSAEWPDNGSSGDPR